MTRTFSNPYQQNSVFLQETNNLSMGTPKVILLRRQAVSEKPTRNHIICKSINYQQCSMYLGGHDPMHSLLW